MNYIEFEGRKISVRPAVEDYEIDENGEYQRQIPFFREAFGKTGKNPVEKDRYILFWAKDCAWSNRIAIVYSMLGLEDSIKEEIVDWTKLDLPVGWECVNAENHVNKESNARFIGELYYRSAPEFIGRPAVPVLYDYKEQKIANNDFQNLSYYLEEDFRAFHKVGAPDLFPSEKQTEIREMGNWLYEHINNAIYKMFFGKNKMAYQRGYDSFLFGMEKLEKSLSEQRFLLGDHISDSDIRLFSTLVRLDEDYGKGLGISEKLTDYPNLFDCCREIYQLKDVRKKIFFEKMYRGKITEEILDEIEKMWSSPVSRSDKSKESDSIHFVKKSEIIQTEPYSLNIKQ